jgi:hypothetical protein
MLHCGREGKMPAALDAAAELPDDAILQSCRTARGAAPQQRTISTADDRRCRQNSTSSKNRAAQSLGATCCAAARKILPLPASA